MCSFVLVRWVVCSFVCWSLSFVLFVVVSCWLSLSFVDVGMFAVVCCCVLLLVVICRWLLLCTLLLLFASVVVLMCCCWLCVVCLFVVCSFVRVFVCWFASHCRRCCLLLLVVG